MSRRQVLLTTVGVALIFVLVVVGVRKREAIKARIPAWLNYEQPPDSVAPDLMTLTPAQSWAANRCRPMVAACDDHTAGRRIRRTYPATLAESDTSFIRGSFQLGGGL